MQTIASAFSTSLIVLVWYLCSGGFGCSQTFDAAPFALALPEGNGLLWEDPREIHRVVVHFATRPLHPESLRLGYWGSRWPQQHLPKNREPGGADVGWMELGNWYEGGWRAADVVATVEGSVASFTFRPIHLKEFPSLKNYEAPFRYTLKLRVESDEPMPKIQKIEAFTDSSLVPTSARLEWQKATGTDVKVEAFNGRVRGSRRLSGRSLTLELEAAANPDPNTFDRTLVTVRAAVGTFTFAADDLSQGPLFLPHLGVAVLPGNDPRDYAAIASEQKASGAKTLYQRIADMPEQTWRAAWAGLPRKKSDIYLPLGLDGGRQRFRLNPDGSIQFRSNDHFLQRRPGKDTPRLNLESPNVQISFGLPTRPVSRTLEENCLPVCRTTWQTNGLAINQTAFVTELGGTRSDGPVPHPDTTAVFMAKLVFTNVSTETQTLTLAPVYKAGEQTEPLAWNGLIMRGDNLRGQMTSDVPLTGADRGHALGPGDQLSIVVKIPYVPLVGARERQALATLDFARERAAVAGYWRRRLDESARLLTPEPMLNEFYRAQAAHLLINCEREPDAPRRFARVGSFHYGAYGNESCMMVLELERRGYHREATECLDAWLKYQGTVGLPGDFSSQAGVLYGAGGYEDGGYNQHHGWILWLLSEHFRFTRDEAWLRAAVPGIRAGADWIIHQTERTESRPGLERGLLPAGRLEDIGDWWPWLSTSCYTWRGLDGAAWALEQIGDREAGRVRRAADEYHERLLANFSAAAERSPVVRLRDGTAVPKIPSQVHRRGRSFGWICETLEGPMHLLITRALDPRSRQAEWILKDYEDNLYLSNQYGYTINDFEKHWFDRGGMSMQACLLLDVEPYLYRDDVKQALRALFNAEAVSYFPDVRMNTEHAAPDFDDWRGDHYKSSDESNACGWLRKLFVREEGPELLIGQGIPREWLRPGQECGLEKAATYFGVTSVFYQGADQQITATLDPPRRNPPKQIRLRFRIPGEQPLRSVWVNGKRWHKVSGDWVQLPGNIGQAVIEARF